MMIMMTLVVWKAVVDVPCNLQRVVINLQRVVDINQYSHIFYNALHLTRLRDQ